MKKLLALLLVLMLLLSSTAALSACGKKSDGSKKTDADASDNAEEEAGPVELSDDLFDYTIQLGEKVYKLPCDPQEFFDDGWEYDSESFAEKEIKSQSALSTMLHHAENGRIEVEFYNPGEEVIQAKDGKIGGIKSVGCDTFVFPKGITKASTEEDIVAAYGEPDERSEFSTFVGLNYRETPDETFMYDGRDNCRWEFEMYPADAEETGIKEFLVYNFRNDAPQVEEPVAEGEAPAYLAEYPAPTELGDDATTGIFKLEGDLYRLPCPFSVFAANGWQMEDADNKEVEANGKGQRFTISKGDKKVTINVKNFSQYPMKAENCAVYNLTVEKYQKAELEFPGGIKIGMPEADVGAIVGDAYNFTEGIGYDYRSTDDDFSNFYIYTNSDDNTVKSFNLTCENWYY